MRAELAHLSHCAVPFLSRAAVNLCWNDIRYTEISFDGANQLYLINYAILK